MATPASSLSQQRTVTCRLCGTGRHIEVVAVPYVFRYLVSELLAMNVKLVLTVA
jgi:DNA-directed RNA polymerase I subunit RPA2